MWRNQQTNYPELHKRLYGVFPEYRPISKMDGPGSYKAIDGAGNVYLVTISVTEEGSQRRTTERLLAAEDVLRQTNPRLFRPKENEGWSDF